MATTVGTLEFQFIADIARLKQDMAEVKRSVGDTTSFIESASNTAKNALGGIASALSVREFAGWIKSAIDAGDATKEFSQKTGVAAQDVAGLQLAFKLGGVEGDALASAIAKLSKNMAMGSDAFALLGVSAQNADGTLRPVKDVLADVADATAKMGDGAEKSAVLQEIFGKSAAALIPTLNEGGAGMRAMADDAERLGLVINSETAEAADKFNDTLSLLGAGVQGAGREIAAGLLPTLQNLADSFLGMMGKTDALSGAVAILAGLLKVLYTTAIVVIEVFQSLGEIFASIAAAAGAIWTELRKGLTGDFSAATGIITDMMERVKTGWTDAIAAVDTAWGDARSTTIPALTEINKGTEAVIIKTVEQKKSVDDVAKAYEGYRDKLLAYRNELTQQLAGGEKLTKAQQMLAQLTANNTAEVTKITGARRDELLMLAKANVELEREALARAESAAATEKLIEQIKGKNESLGEEIRAQKSANDEAKNGADASGLLAIAKLREAAATSELNANTEIEKGGNAELADQYRQQATALRELADLKSQGIQIQAAKQAADEWKKTTDSIGQSLTDALMRGFESGAKFADVFKTTLINMFKTLILRPILQPIVQGAAGMVTGLLGMGANASGGGGAAGGLGTLSNLYSAGKFLPGMSDTVLSSLYSMSTQGGLTGTLGNVGFNYASSLAEGPGGMLGGGLMSAGAGFAGGLLGNSIFGGGGQSNLGATVGGTIGSVVGSYFPVLGTSIGAAIGSFLGSGLGSLFGNNKTPKVQFTTLGAGGDLGALQDYNKLNPKGRGEEVYSESAFGIIGLGGKTRQVDAQDFKKTFDAIAQIDNMVASALNPAQIAKVSAALKGFTSAVNATADTYTRDRLILIATTIDETMGKIVGGFKGSIDDMAKLTASLAAIDLYKNADLGGVIRGVADAATAASRTLFENWQNSSATLSDMAANFDGSLSMANQLAGVTSNTYQMELSLVAQIQQALAGTQAMFASSIDQIKMSVLDTAGQYDFLKKRADDYVALLAQATDPQKITQYAEAINKDALAAFNLLDATGKATKAPEFEKYLSDVSTLTTDKLNASQDLIVSSHQQMADVIEDVMTRVAEKMAAAADAVAAQQAETARQGTQLVGAMNQWVARLPTSFQVVVKGSEVAF